MSELTTLEILKAARAKIARPEDWGKGIRGYARPASTCCAGEALLEAAPIEAPFLETFKKASRAIHSAAGLSVDTDYLHKWNDEPKRTHADVLAAYDLAIATVGLT